jgi:ABC-type sugar transport system substrate-binding protein
MKKLRLLLSLITELNDFQLEQAACAESCARKLGVDLQILSAESDTITQSTHLLRAIQSEAPLRPDAILFELVGGMALPQVARAAVAAGVGWAAPRSIATSTILPSCDARRGFRFFR